MVNRGLGSGWWKCRQCGSGVVTPWCKQVAATIKSEVGVGSGRGEACL